ncbi:hypothetical protein WKI71_36575 [Streptomyces sp. MS1.AVA.1]|uniref:Uncharacterized protein n=1 Tax=Streptomyces machairae TaxID=3134109 RepID=A0ABU8UTG1_9ACTN
MLRAGDVLVVAFEKHQTEAETKRFTDGLKEQLPGIRVLLLEGVSGLAAFRPQEKGVAVEGGSDG